MSDLTIHMFPCLADNYGYLLHDAESGATAAVDTPDAAAIEAQLDAKGWRLTHILNTHHHADHAGGNLELKRRTGCTIVGPRADAARIPGIDVAVGEGDVVELGSHRAAVFDTPGHTRGHIVYHFAADRAAFVGDTLFALGCGRLFEGTPGADVELAAENSAVAGRHANLLRARIHAEQCAFRFDRRAAESRSQGAGGGGGAAARRGPSDGAEHARRGARDEPVLAAAKPRLARDDRATGCRGRRRVREDARVEGRVLTERLRRESRLR